jgi:glucokinase
MSSSQEQFAIGVDIGATKVASVLLSEQGDVIQSSHVLTLAEEGPQAVLDRVAEQILDLAQRTLGPLAGVGIGSPWESGLRSGQSL